jgi:PEP-CTERM motif
MKFQLKALAAAAILAASIPAQAALDTATSGNSSFVLTVLDKVANVQASFDLGKNYLDFNQVASAGALGASASTSFSWNLAANPDYAPAWTSFLAAATLPNIQYAITAADNTGGAGPGSRGYITTLAAVGAAPLVNSGMISAMANFDTYVINENIGHVAANGSLFSNTAATASTVYGNNRVGGSSNGPTTVGVLGSNLGLIQVVYGGTTAFANTTTTVFGNSSFFNLASNGTLVYSVAAVPEADTWAMMMLGLGFMGFVARRKQA